LARRHWQADRDARAVAALGRACRTDAAAKRRDDAAADGKSKADAGAAPVILLHAVELVEDAFEFLRRYPLPFIAHAEDDLRPILPGGHFRRCPRRRVFVGIVEQVENDLLEKCGVAMDERQIRLDGKLDRALGPGG